MELLGVIFLLGSLVKTITAGVTMEVKFVHYKNPDGEGSNGECCDGKSVFCFSACDHKFNICLDKATGSNSISDCPYGNFISSEITDADTITFGSSFGGVKNPMFFRMKSWPGSVKLKVVVHDADPGSNPSDHVESLQREISEKVSPDRASATTSSYTLKKRTTLSVKVKTYCDKNYYGAACDTFCLPQNNTKGHYTCDKNDGKRVCLPGWQGTFCDDNGVNECFDNDPCHNNHVCLDRPVGYECACPLGTSGENCSSVDFTCADTPCKNGGNCSIESGNLTCTCPLGWKGDLCEEAVNPCGDSPCENNGTCSIEHFGFSCLCHEGFVGDVCNITDVTTTTFIETTTITVDTTTGEMTTDTIEINSTEVIPTTTHLPETSTALRLAFIMLKGRLLGGNKDDVRKGIKNLLMDQMNLKGDVQIVLQNKPTLLKNGEIVTKVIVGVRENGNFLEPESIQKVFQETDMAVLEQYIPLPIYREGAPRTAPLLEGHNSWIHDNWYVVLVVFVVIIALCILLTAFIVYKRKRSVGMGQKDVVARPNSSVSDAFPAQSFENSLYFEMNNHQRKSSNTRVKVNVNPTS
ncbi:protein jagged-2-like [Pecten maximus]|uniref:protein jagged-2-like n=1 Tax=Pecten maximus TaxID=6579 RepID=UPI0014590562|nr:protein jagged-2-like [Pecten maximus]